MDITEHAPPKYPPGTPQYEAYREALAVELEKFAAGLPSYQVDRTDETPSDSARTVVFATGDSVRFIGPDEFRFAKHGIVYGRTYTVRDNTHSDDDVISLAGVRGVWSAGYYELVSRAADHQPAPEPEPTGPQFGHALVDGQSVHGFMTTGQSGAAPIFVFPMPDSGYMQVTSEVFSDFVPNEFWPPVTREERANVVDLLIALSNEILTLVRGESR
jgi:hypothetical protein